MVVTKFFDSEKELFEHIEQFFNTFVTKVSTLHNLYQHNKKLFNEFFAKNFYSKEQYINGYTDAINYPELKSFKIDVLNNKVYFNSPFKCKITFKPRVWLNGILRINEPYLDFMYISGQKLIMDWNLLTSITNNFNFAAVIMTDKISVALNIPNDSINITTVNDDIVEAIINFDGEAKIREYKSYYSSTAIKEDKVASVGLIFKSETKQKFLHEHYFRYNFIYKIKSITDIPKVSENIKEFLDAYIKEHFQNESNVTTFCIENYRYNLHVDFKFKYDNIEYFVFVLIQILGERF